MKHLPQLDPDERGNTHLWSLLKCLHPDDRASFVRKLTTQSLRERFHTYRELLLGAQIRKGGADFRYEQKIDGQTPDWSLLNSGKTVEIIDVVTLHQRHDKEIEITASLRATESWNGWIAVPPEHIYRKLNDKAGQYSELARRLQVPYVLAIYGEWLASIAPEEVEHVLYKLYDGLFATAPEVPGVIYFHQKNFRFEFVYFTNPAPLQTPAVWSSQVERWADGRASSRSYD